MPTKLVHTAPIAVTDSLDAPIRDEKVLAVLAGISCLSGTVLEYLDVALPDRAKLRGGYLRLVRSGKRLALTIEIESPRELTKSELAAIRADLDGQVSDSIGEGGFDFVGETGVTIRTFPGLGRRKSTLTQSPGTAWKPKSKAAETAANRRRCEAVASAMQANDAAKAKAKAKKADPKALFKLIQKGHRYPRPDGIESEFAAEIEKLGGDLSFIPAGQLPYERLGDLELLRILLDANLNPNLHDRDGHSLLWLAVGNPKCVALLLDRGADVNLRNAMVYQDTALMDAARSWLQKSVEVLLERGADPTLKDFFGRSALDLVRMNHPEPNTPAIIRLLEEATARRQL